MKIQIKKEIVNDFKNSLIDGMSDVFYQDKLEILANILIKDEIKKHKEHKLERKV